MARMSPEKSAPPNYCDLPSAELLGELQDLLSELRWRIGNYLELGSGSAEATDEGLLLAVKSDRILGTALYGGAGFYSISSMKRKLEEAAVGGEADEAEE